MRNPRCRRACRSGYCRGSLSGRSAGEGAAAVRLVGSGAILREAIAAADMLAADWNVASEVFSATSFSELEREAAEVQRLNRLQPRDTPRVSHVEKLLAGTRAHRRRERLRPRLSPTHRRFRRRRASRRWEPTVSDAATRGRRCAASSRSTGATSRWRRFTRSPKRERSGTPLLDRGARTLRRRRGTLPRRGRAEGAPSSERRAETEAAASVRSAPGAGPGEDRRPRPCPPDPAGRAPPRRGDRGRRSQAGARRRAAPSAPARP